jgi:hypothetical protein
MREREGDKGYQQAAGNRGCSGRWLTTEGLRSDAGWLQIDELFLLKSMNDLSFALSKGWLREVNLTTQL